MDVLIDPVLADLQAEYDDASRSGRRWQRRWVWMLGHTALIKVVIWHSWERIVGMLPRQNHEDQRTLNRSFGFSLAVVAVTTVLLSAPIVHGLDAWNHPRRTRLVVYAVPQAIPLAIPVGVTVGILAAFGRGSSSRRARAMVVVMAVAASAASLTMLAWVVPTSNQAFRIAVAGRPVVRGVNELTLAELGERLGPGVDGATSLAAPSSRRHLERAYHTRWALSCAPLALSLFAVSVTSRARRGRLTLGLIGTAAIVAYYAIGYTAFALGSDRTVSVFMAAWAPNLAFLLMSGALMRPRPSLTAR